MIYARGFAAGGVGAGVRLGIMFGIVYTGANLISYGAQPFPGHLITVYSIAGLIEYAIAGAIVARFTRKARRRSYNAVVIRVYDAAPRLPGSHAISAEQHNIRAWVGLK